jgi:hypothetical protein
VHAPGRFTRVVLGLALLSAGLLAGTGCRTGGPETPAPRPEDPGLAGYPSEDTGATRAYLATLTFTASPRVSAVTCDSGATTTLRVYPEVRSHRLDTTSAKLRGHIVARVVNAGPSRCDTLRLSPGDTAYWWMGPDRGYTLTTAFWRIPSSGSVIRLAHTGRTRINAEAVRDDPDARIGEGLMHPVPIRPPDDGDGGTLRFMHLSTWIACLGACCESNTLERDG